MHRLLICVICSVLSVSVSCAPTKQTVTEVKNGAFKVLVRSREFHHSSIDNVDVCVTDASSTKFPTDTKLQCLLSGYDFSGLSVKWQSDREIEVSFRCGRVSSFSNDATVLHKGAPPVEFHAILREDCDYTGSKTCRGCGPVSPQP